MPLPPGFLAEMMDLNEALMEIQMEEDEAKLNTLKQELDSYTGNINSNINDLAGQYDQQPSEALLLKIKDLYYQRKYLSRLYDRLAGEQTM